MGPVLNWSGFLLALAGGGCLGKVFLGSLALAWGAGSGSALFAFAFWFDDSPLRMPFLLAAAAAALASLVLAVREHRLRRAQEARNGCVIATPSEKRRNLLVAAVSFAALLLVGAELAFHSGRGAGFRRSIGLLAPDERGL
jgi:hypothetical protein